MAARILTAFLLLLLTKAIQANVAQPGMWQAGGMENFALLFPEDSLAYKKIQMVDERVSILLYPGFAVVKGEYWMRNETDSTLIIRTGYPINSDRDSRTSQSKMQIWFEELYGLKVISDGEPNFIRKEVIDDNWYTWMNTFEAGATTKIDVYFMMLTNDASILEGYSKNKVNGFIYLLESGASWKQPILQGEIRIKLAGKLDMDDINGVAPSNVFKRAADRPILRWQFSELSPNFQHNIIINYGEPLEDFNFSEVLQAQEKYFSLTDDFSEEDLGGYPFASTEFSSPFIVPAFNDLQPTGFYGWYILLRNGIGFLLVAGFVYFLYRRFDRSA